MATAAQGPEESVYVVLDLADREALPPPGSRLLLQGMETQQPVLQVADGTRLVGAFEETVGTQLILADAVAGDGSHRVHLVGHTDKRICFTKASEPAASSREEGEGVGGAAAAQAGAGRGLPHPTEGPS